jgi:hypothetical protein
MPHFPATFAVKSYPERHTIRVSVRVSETRVDEWWVPGEDLPELLAATNGGWRGSGSIRVRLRKDMADVALASGDRRTLLRVSVPEGKLLLARLRTAEMELHAADVPTPLEVPGLGVTEALIGGGVDEDTLRRVIQEELHNHEVRMAFVLRDALRGINAPQVPAPAPVVEPSAAEPTTNDFIPAARDDTSGRVQSTTRKSSSIMDAVRALKEKK